MKPFLLSLAVIIGLSLSATVFAIEYTPIVNIPKIDVAKATTKEYIQALYYLAISAAALIAVVKIIYGGVQYMLDGIVTHKEQARKDIQGALFGLLIVLSAVLILNTINPQLTTLEIFGNAPKLDAINATPVAVTTPKTLAEDCPSGSEFVVGVDGTGGTCVTKIATPSGEDYSDDPGAGQADCGSTTKYNPDTNTCDLITTVYVLTDSEIAELEDRSGGDSTIFIQNARDFCKGRGQNYDVDTKACVD